MSISHTETKATKQKAVPTILRHGFRHPRSSSDTCVKAEAPEIKWKACSWDTIEDERKDGISLR